MKGGDYEGGWITMIANQRITWECETNANLGVFSHIPSLVHPPFFLTFFYEDLTHPL